MKKQKKSSAKNDMKLVRTLILALLLVAVVSVRWVPVVHAQEKVFSASELATNDGLDGHRALFAYNGKVYDVTGSKSWKLGVHFGLHAGMDLTGMMAKAPHGEEVLARFPVVGTFASTTPPVVLVSTSSATANDRSWYDAPIRILGISILGWTGILLGITFLLNFATCFALPWSKFDLPWTGTRPGADALDSSGIHMKWTMLHKYFAWATLILGLIHGIIGFLQVFVKMYL